MSRSTNDTIVTLQRVSTSELLSNPGFVTFSVLGIGVNGRPNVRFNPTVIGHRTVIGWTSLESEPYRTYRTFS
jgi:hypothetical protein